MMSQEQIAQALGIRREAIRDVEHRALRKFKQAVIVLAAAAGVSPRDWLLGEGRDGIEEDAA